MTEAERLREIIKYHVEAYGGTVNPKDDFNGFINDILNVTTPSPEVKKLTVSDLYKIIYNSSKVRGSSKEFEELAENIINAMNPDAGEDKQ